MNPTTHPPTTTNTFNSSKNPGSMNAQDRGVASQRSKPEENSACTDTAKPERRGFVFDFGATLKEKKDQLHRRVTARLTELESALANLKEAALQSEYAKALRSEIDIAKDTMSGGWEHIGEIEAAQLSQWLKSSQYLTDNSCDRPDLNVGELDKDKLPTDEDSAKAPADRVPTPRPL
jgi:hypothetical protein